MRAVVIGLAETGVAVTRRLCAEGWEVTILEDSPRAGADYARRVEVARSVGATIVESPTAAGVGSVVGGADLVMPSPLVRVQHPALEAARAASIPIRSEIDLAGERTDKPIVAITGTNGKTTVTTLTAEMLNASGRSATAAGNLGRPLIEAIDDAVEVLVAEVSSFQLACSETFHPLVAVLLAIAPDHLDWHGSYQSYVAAKARITERQTSADLLVFDADDADASAIAAASRADVVGFSRHRDAGDRAREVDGQLVNADGAVFAEIAGMRRALLHDRTNALAAGLAALAVGATTTGIRAALAAYATLPHRVALVGEAGGVNWYDDSKATNPDATLRAVESFDSVVLLAGGRNKGLDLGVLAGAREHVRGVVAFGEAAPEVAAAFRDAAPVVLAGSMHEAVIAAAELAQPGDVVLLSPACASFDAYENYGARGDDFAAEVRGLSVEGAPLR